MKTAMITLAAVFALTLTLGGCGSSEPADYVDKGGATAKQSTSDGTQDKQTCAEDDVDCDGFGTRPKPDGTPLDCDDGDANVHPTVLGYEAVEVCNGADDDCNGQTDEGSPTATLYRDEDGDGYGVEASRKEECLVEKDLAPVGWSLKKGDCNDSDKETHPDAKDNDLDGIDQDCDDLDGQAAKEQQDESSDQPAKPGTLKLTSSKEQRLAVSYELVSKAADFGKGEWKQEAKVEAWASELMLDIADLGNACALRFSLQIGGGSNATWSCLGDGNNAKANELLTALEFSMGGMTLTLEDAQVWPDPSGSGCSLVLTWGDACAL